MTFAPKRLSDHVQAVLDALIAAEGHMTVAQLQKATGRPTAEVQGALKDLCLWGIAMSVGERWNGATKFIHHSKLRATPRPSRKRLSPGAAWTGAFPPCAQAVLTTSACPAAAAMSACRTSRRSSMSPAARRKFVRGIGDMAQAPTPRRAPVRADHRAWTPMEDDIVRATFPYVHNQVLAGRLGRSEPAIVNRAAKLGVRKAPEYLAQHPTRFQAGHKPWNTGMKGFQPGGRSVQTQFRKGQMAGQAARNYKPIGSLRINADGYLERKVTDAHPVPARRWVGVHRLVWEAAHGPVPRSHVVRFRAGMFTNVLEEITLDRLELISRAEHARRNHPVSRDPEYARLVQLKGAITRQVNRIAREHKERNA